MNDMLNADEVEIIIDGSNKLWVNVNGLCALRVGHVKVILTDDPCDGKRMFAEDEK